MNLGELKNAFDPLYILLVNFSWLLYLIPGYFILDTIRSKDKSQKSDNAFTTFAYSFFYSALLLLPFNILQFIFTIPSWVVVGYFFAITIFAIYKLRGKIKQLNPVDYIKSKLPITKNKLFWFTLFVVFAAFVMGQIIKGFSLFEFDAWMHISKINYMRLNGLSNFDPYLLESGKNVIQSNFFSNLVHTIMIVPSTLLGWVGIKAYYVWVYSISIFQLFGYACVYLFAKKVTNNKDFSYFLTTVYFITTFATQNGWLSQYPTRVAFAFMLILFVLLINYLWNSKKFFSTELVILILGTIGISFLHQVMASLFILFAGGLALVATIFKEINYKKFLLICGALLLALPTAIYTLVNSKFMPNSVFSLADSSDWIIKLSSKFTMTKYPDAALTAITAISIIAIVSLPLIVKERTSRLFLLYSVAFTNLLLYSPLFGIVNKFIPTWGIVRIDYYVIIINLLLLLVPVWVLFERIRDKYNLDYTTIISTLAVVSLLIYLPYQKDLKLFYDVSSWNQGSYLNVKDLLTFESYIKPHSTILANKSVSFSIPGMYNAYSAVLDNERTTDSIDTTERWADLGNFFVTTKNKQDRINYLKKYNVDYIITGEKEKNSFTESTANELGYVKLKESFAYKLYEKK